MKHKFLIAAGLLALGASPALAFSIPPMKPDMAKAVKDVWADQMAASQTSLDKTATDQAVPEKLSPFDTGEAWMSPIEPTKASQAAFVDKAALDTFDKPDATLAKADDTAGKADESLAMADDAAVKSDDTLAKTDAALASAGPSEPVMQTISTPAAAAYPPCHRGAGDDHCIQLYEPGVRAQLAEWNRSAAGSETAMGGPYEPVDSTLAGEMGNAGAAPAPAGDQYNGVGGPLETNDYPPCSRTVTDRCIQLYERGVHR